MDLPQRWGFCMAGNEQAFCNALDLAVLDPKDPYIYFEIGIGNGDTMEAARQWLSGRELPYFIVGVDLPDYSGTVRNLGWHQIFMNGKTEEVHVEAFQSRHVPGAKCDVVELHVLMVTEMPCSLSSPPTDTASTGSARR